jgi:hypothetical protein
MHRTKNTKFRTNSCTLSSKVAAHNTRLGSQFLIFCLLIFTFMTKNRIEDRHVSTERHQTAATTDLNAWFAE